MDVGFALHRIGLGHPLGRDPVRTIDSSSLGRIVSHTAPVLRTVIDNSLRQSGINITPAHKADHVTMGISLVMSTRGVGLLPAYAQNSLPSS
jgi:hypothetical protein